jgi:hypothetical protein
LSRFPAHDARDCTRADRVSGSLPRCARPR